MPTKETILKKYDEVLEHIKTVNIKTFPGHKEPLFLISDTYPGVWLEHVYDSVLWAQLCPEMAYTARAAVELFLDEQNPEGQFPCYVLDSSNPRSKAFGQTVGYGQLQECVSFARLCYETAQLNRDPALMQRSYDACIRWNTWLKRYRMTQGKGLIELFCLFDTGHDNSIRLSGVPNDTPGADARVCNEKPDLLPLFAPDLNAVYYDTLTALGDMARALNKPEEASRWYADANYLRITLDTVCYDPEDGFYYDADRFGNRRKCKSISITNLYAVVDKKVTVDEVNAAMKAYAATISETFGYNEDDIVSTDIIGEAPSSTPLRPCALTSATARPSFRSPLGTTTRTPTPLRWSAPSSTSRSSLLNLAFSE